MFWYGNHSSDCSLTGSGSGSWTGSEPIFWYGKSPLTRSAGWLYGYCSLTGSGSSSWTSFEAMCWYRNHSSACLFGGFGSGSWTHSETMFWYRNHSLACLIAGSGRSSWTGSEAILWYGSYPLKRSSDWWSFCDALFWYLQSFETFDPISFVGSVPEMLGPKMIYKTGEFPRSVKIIWFR